MKPATNPNQQLLDLLGITGKHITRVVIECRAGELSPMVTVTSCMHPFVIKDDELQTTTAHYRLVPASDGLQAEPEPLDFQAMADAAMARVHAFIVVRAYVHQMALRDAIVQTQKRQWARQLISDLACMS